MSILAGAVFVSYASEDAAAAARIVAALRAAALEVWFDQSELRGGDAWDRRIREQIRDCRLFLAVISAHSEGRDEGYFRREWKLAVDRSHDMAEKKAFIVPVVIDDTGTRGAAVPDKFHEVQWTRLPGGEPTAAFVERVVRLLHAPPASASEAAHAAEHPAVPTPSARRGLRVPRLAVVASGFIVVAGLGYLALRRPMSVQPVTAAAPTVAAIEAPAEAAATPGGAGPSPQSLAVLPMVNESGDASQQYFSDGLSEDLITALSQSPQLRVIGRVSSFRFRDSKDDARTIGAKLGVGHLLEGSVRRAGNLVRISAELVNTRDGSTQWSDRYDRPYKDLFALQDEIARAVARALETKLLTQGVNQVRYERPPSGSLEAYAALLQGRFYHRRFNEADWRRAIKQFTRATELDPRYATAWSELSKAWAELAGYYLAGEASRAALASARAAGERALALAPDLALAHVAFGSLAANVDFDQSRAEAEIRRALQLAPADEAAVREMGMQFGRLGQPARAVRLFEQALSIDPLDGVALRWYATYLAAAGRLAEAEQAARKALELAPDSDAAGEGLTAIEIQRGDATAAIAAARRTPAGGYRDVALALATQVGSDRAAADASLQRLIDKYANQGTFQIAEAYALRHDADKTFEWLERAWQIRDPGIVGRLLTDPFIGRYRTDPRFAAFCRKVGLPAPGETLLRD